MVNITSVFTYREGEYLVITLTKADENGRKYELVLSTSADGYNIEVFNKDGTYSHML